MKLHLAYFLTALLSANAQDGRDLVGYAPPRCDGKLVTKIVNMEKDGNGVQFNRGNVPTTLEGGLAVNARRTGGLPATSNDAVMFDTRPGQITGADKDLETVTENIVLVINERNNPSLPDDNRKGKSNDAFAIMPRILNLQPSHPTRSC